jgi:hypothetical protein
MPRLDQVVIKLDAETLLTLTIRVEGPRGRRGGIERRREELIAAQLWMAAQGVDAATAPDD